jgi:hypothetical protein
MPEVFTPIELFRESVSFTYQRYGFPERLIEKDYVCTIILEFLTAAHPDLVFKGGTCLAKIYANFYRMSEDLDFVIPMPIDAPRSARSARARKLVQVIAALPQTFPFAHVAVPLRGANNSTQYNAIIGYNSAIDGRGESIKIEVSLREPLLLPHIGGEAKTLLLDPASGDRLVPTRNVRCIAKIEAFAEKFRAALSRREAAVRDFFDLDYAVRTLGLNPDDADLIALVRQKMSVTKSDRVDVSESRLSALRQQVEPELRSVLRAEEYAAFDLRRSIDLVVGMATRIG